MPLIIDDAKKTIIIKYLNRPEPVAYNFKDLDCVLIRDAHQWEGHKSMYLITKAHKEHFIKAGDPSLVEQMARTLASSLGDIPILTTGDDGAMRPLSAPEQA